MSDSLQRVHLKRVKIEIEDLHPSCECIVLIWHTNGIARRHTGKDLEERDGLQIDDFMYAEKCYDQINLRHVISCHQPR